MNVVAPRQAASDEIAHLFATLRAQVGFRADAIQPEVLIRVAASHLKVTREHLSGPMLREALRREPSLIKAITDAMLVAETYFFRHPEHFAYAADWLHGRICSGQQRFRVWSAGCSSGEEAYSLASCLRALGQELDVEVLGSDVSEKALAVAREGRYGSWSCRAGSPLLFPVGIAQGQGRERSLRVLPALMQRTRFLRHNLLDPLPPGEGPFDVIFCRNVLVYFDERSAARVCENLAERLSASGLLVLGSVDAHHPPPGLARMGPPGMNAYHPPAPISPVAPPLKLEPRLPERPPLTVAPILPKAFDPVAAHTRALVLVERGRHSEANRALAELNRVSPGYLPGLLERALLFFRGGRHQPAAALMTELLRRTEGIAADAVVRGPEDLPVSFYRTSAETYLKSRQAAVEAG